MVVINAKKGFGINTEKGTWQYNAAKKLAKLKLFDIVWFCNKCGAVFITEEFCDNHEEKCLVINEEL